MQRIVRAGLPALATLVVVAGCGKKTMDTPPPVTTPPVETVAPPPPPPPPPVETRPAPMPLHLGDVYFDYDSASLNDAARATLSENGRMMVSNPSRVLIEGHCDERGTVDYNQALGQRRADAAKEFLVSYGVDAGSLSTVSFGENKPFDMGHNEAAWRANRCAHLAPVTR